MYTLTHSWINWENALFIHAVEVHLVSKETHPPQGIPGGARYESIWSYSGPSLLSSLSCELSFEKVLASYEPNKIQLLSLKYQPVPSGPLPANVSIAAIVSVDEEFLP